MSLNPSFFDEMFKTYFETLKVFGKHANQVLNAGAAELLQDECINYEVMSACLKGLVDADRHLVIAGDSRLSMGLLHTLKAIGGFQLSVFNFDAVEKEICGVPVICKLEDHHVLLDDLFSDKALQARYKALLEQHQMDLACQLAYFKSDRDSKVIFAAKKVYFNQLRLSTVLRDHGYKTIAVVFDYAMAEHQRGFFDLVIYTDLLSFLLWVNKVDMPTLLHTQGWLFRYHVPVLIDIYKSDSCRQIIEMMDSQSFYLPESTVRKIPDTLKKAWGENALENHKQQLEYEHYIVHHSDGVIFNGDETYREPLIKEDSDILKNKHLSFPALPVRNFFQKSTAVNKSRKLVFIGGVPPFSINRPHELFGDSQMLGLVKKLVNKGCYLDIYNNPLIARKDQYDKLYPDFVRLAEDCDRFNFLVGDMPGKINRKIAPYDFGLMVYEFYGTHAGDLHFKHLLPTKLFSYLEAGLPILVSDRLKAVCDIVNEYEIGVVVSEHEIDLIPEIIAVTDVTRLKKNVIFAREELQMHNNIHRLTGFYKQIMA